MSVQDFTIRTFRGDDIRSLRTMHAKAWSMAYTNESQGVSVAVIEEHTCGWLTKDGLDKSKEYFLNQVVDNPEHYLRLAIDNVSGRVLGFIHATNEDNSQYIKAIYIDDTMYGTGLSHILMNGCMEWFDFSKDVTLMVADYNERAKHFYKKYNFTEKSGSEFMFKDIIPGIWMIRKGEK